MPKLIDLRSCASGRWKSLDKQRRLCISRRFKIYVLPRGLGSAQWFFIGPFAQHRRKKKRYTAVEVSMVRRKCDRSFFTPDRKRIRLAYTAVILSASKLGDRPSIVSTKSTKRYVLQSRSAFIFNCIWYLSRNYYLTNTELVLWIYLGNKFRKFFSKFVRLIFSVIFLPTIFWSNILIFIFCPIFQLLLYFT